MKKNENSFQTNLNQRSRNDQIDDPWVKELLRREIDFSKLYEGEEEEEVQLLHIPYIKPLKLHSQRSSDHYPFQTRIKAPDHSSLIMKNNSDPYRSRSNSLCKYNSSSTFFSIDFFLLK